MRDYLINSHEQIFLMHREKNTRFRAEWDNKADQLIFQHKLKDDMKQTKAELQLLRTASVQVIVFNNKCPLFSITSAQVIIFKSKCSGNNFQWQVAR